MMSILQQTVQTLLAHRMKSLLAMIAIAWGVISVVVLMALGEGFYRHQSQSFSFLTEKIQYAFPSYTSKPWKGLASRREIRITQQQVELLRQSDFVESVAVNYAKWDASVTNSKGQSLSRFVAGIDAAYFDLTQRKLLAGSRNLSPSDLSHHSRVAVLGNQVAQMGNIQLGDSVNVNGIPFRVIGVVSDEDGGRSFGDARKVFIPHSTFRDLWNSKPWLMLVKPASGIDSPALRQYILRFYARQLHFDPNDTEAIYLPDYSEGANIINGILTGIQLFLAASGAMTMAVGALGVANILFLSVTERTREIGVRLAIGASQSSILAQFIVEGLILVSVGTMAGLLCAFGLVALLGNLSLPDWIGLPTITLSAIGMSMLVMMVLALLASYFPAKRASNLTPVIALSARA
ncbi:ABC transporter permease [Vibrio ostreicida]|uniref:ABC transporter permease n=1 Tax=Vibrio ostreicida TaxID=526588 RepID=UPI000970EFB2|nr:ABC transporter permease [Vibrio ostreicida]